MRDKRRRLLTNPTGHHQGQVARHLPEDFDELTDEERQRILEDSEEVVASVDLTASRQEEADLAFDESSGRLSYEVSAGVDAAGAPGFDADLNPAFLHLGCEADFCFGVSLARVVEQLRVNGQSHWLGEQAAAL